MVLYLIQIKHLLYKILIWGRLRYFVETVS